MVDPSVSWNELIAEFVRRTGQEGVANPIVPEVKDLVSIARNQGLICNGMSVTITDQDQARKLLESVPLLPGMTIDFNDVGTASAPASPPKKATTTPPTGKPKRKCAGHRVKAGIVTDESCAIESTDLKVDLDGDAYCQHHEPQGNWKKPAPQPVVQTEDEIRAEIQDIIDDRAGKTRHELRDLINPLLRKLPGFDVAKHVNQLFDVRMDMLGAKLDPKRFRWDDVKAPKPKAQTSSGPGSASPPPKKSKPTKGAKKVKAVKPKPKKAPIKNPKPTATTAPNHKKGAKSAPAKNPKGSAMPVPSTDDLERELESDSVQISQDAQLAANFYALWAKQDTDAQRAKAIRTLTKDKKRYKRVKPYLPQELLEAAEAKGDTGDGKTTTGKAPKGVDKAAYDAAKVKAEQLKADGKNKGEATLELASDNVDPAITNAVITEVFV